MNDCSRIWEVKTNLHDFVHGAMRPETHGAPETGGLTLNGAFATRTSMERLPDTKRSESIPEEQRQRLKSGTWPWEIVNSGEKWI
jgi:hypothetical protein